MGRAPCCAKIGLHRGPWTPKEDALLRKYIQAHGEGQWRSLPKRAGLLRCGKSCRLRWMNYLRPDIKRGNITPEEDDLIIRMHSLLGNRWSLIAGRLPGRTDNEIKNYWNTYLSKRLKAQLGPDHQETSKRSNNNKKRKKKSTKNNNKNKSNTNVEDEAEEEKKTNIYLPKPIRVRALSVGRNDSTTTLTIDSNNSSSSASGSSSQNKDESPELLEKDVNVNYGLWGENSGFGSFIEEDHNIDLFNASISEDNNDTECQSLEKLYEEYLQLLKNNNSDENQRELDSFAQSLFV